MGSVTDLHEYFSCCSECGSFTWYIQWNTRCTEVMQLVCANPDCNFVIENPEFHNGQIYFEPDFDLDDDS